MYFNPLLVNGALHRVLNLLQVDSICKLRNVGVILLFHYLRIAYISGIDTSNPNGVVIGLAPSCFNYPTMNQAFRLVISLNFDDVELNFS